MRLAPHYDAIGESFRRIAELRESNKAVELLMREYLSSWSFDEDWYLQSYPDLANAFPSSVFPDGFSHFIAVGYYEGRAPAPLEIDEDWYLATYPDVANAVIQGLLASAEEHFVASGYREGRLPADPAIDAGWYAATYMGGDKASAEKCFDHFVTVGYLNGALPRARI